MTTHVATPASTKTRGPSPIALALILSIQLMVVLDVTVVNVALPTLQDALGFTPTELSWVVNAYALSFGGLLLLGARAGDLLGRRAVLIAGVILFTAASLLGGIASDSTWLLAARAAQGVGAAIAAPQALALLTLTFPEGNERTRALGWYSAVSIGGSAVGMLLGGVLTEWLSWRWVFFVNVPVGIAIVALAPAFLPDSPRHSGRFDLLGAITSTIGMTSLVYGLVHAAEHGWRTGETVAALTLGVVLLAAFVTVERRSSQPITPLALFANRERVVSYVARLLLVAGMMGMFFFLTQFMQEVRGLTPVQTGLAFVPLTAALLVTSQLSARDLVERLGGRTLMIGGLALSTAAMAVLAQISVDSSYVMIIGALAMFGAGNGLAFIPLTSMSLKDVPPEHAGAASGLVNVMQQVGGSLGLAVLVTIFGTAVRNASSDASTAVAQHHEVLAQGIAHAFVAAAVLLAGALLAITIGTRRDPSLARQR